MSTESVKFTIALSGIYHDKKPQYSILIDDQEYASGFIKEASGISETIEFDVDLNEGPHSLNIKLLNKEPGDTVKSSNDPVNFEIVKDMLLNVEKIKIDSIDLDSLIWTESEYVLDKPYTFNGETVSSLKSCVNLGWNGTYTIQINSPVYIWLLEKL